MELKYYIEAMMTQEPFVLAWEAFVFFMLLMFISIIIRLHSIENKVDGVIEEIIENIESK